MKRTSQEEREGEREREREREEETERERKRERGYAQGTKKRESQRELACVFVRCVSLYGLFVCPLAPPTSSSPTPPHTFAPPRHAAKAGGWELLQNRAYSARVPW